MGSNAKTYTLPDFIRLYAPSLPELALQDTLDDDERICQTWVSPFQNLTIKPNLQCISCCEALPGLVDHVISTLLQHQNKRNRNVLAQGYVHAEDDHIRPCPTMTGVLCTQVNDNVSFCKSSSYAKRLHALIGDDMMRLLLLQTTVFLPMNNGNYLLLCGPILPKRENKQMRPMTFHESNTAIPRYKLFYNSAFVPKIGLPSSHVLNGTDCKELLQSMFPLNKRTTIHQTKMGIQLFRSHAKCDYARILNRYCPLPEFQQEPILSQLATSNTPGHKVVSFLKAILKHAFPQIFWGSVRNFNQVLTKVETFVLLRRQEQFPNKALVQGLRVKDFSWLWRDTDGTYTKSDYEVATLRLQCIMRWLFCRFLVPLLRSLFYITESEFTAKLTLYYRKPVWSIFRSLSMKKLLSSQYTAITRTEAIQHLSAQEMGFSKLRLLPKQTGVRPLAMLQQRVFMDFETSRHSKLSRKQSSDNHNNIPSAPPQKKRKFKETRFQSTNFILDNTFKVLRFERSQKPYTFGAGINGLNELKPLLSEFLTKVRDSNKKKPGHETKLYFSSVDIQHCYDSIRQDHLLSFLPDLLSQNKYLIQNHAVLHPFASMGRISKRNIHLVGPPEEYTRFHQIALDLATKYEESIFLDVGRSTIVAKDDMVKLLEEHLSRHLVVVDGRYGRRMLLQKQGIPQGSILSSMLCNFYYCQMEQLLLTNTGLLEGNVSAKRRGEHLLVRIVDDFLLISTNRSVSQDFVKRMSNGDSALGVQINKRKTLTSYSFTLSNPDGSEAMLEEGVIKDNISGKAFFPWCGLHFNVVTGEVSVDYSRFAHRKAIHGLTIDRSCNEGMRFKIRMKSFVRPRCQPILFDPFINSQEVIASNFYQMMMLSAIKSGEYMRAGLNVRSNPTFIVQCIDDLILYSQSLITTRTRSDQRENKGFFGQRQCVFYLAMDAFHFVLTAIQRNNSYFDCKIVLVSLEQRMLRSSLRSNDDLSKLISMSRKQFDLPKMVGEAPLYCP